MYKISELLKIVKPINQIINQPNALISQLCFDSRKVKQPHLSLFFAILSSKNDGHVYIKKLLQEGVSNFIITHDIENYLPYSNANFIQVKNAIAALQQITAFHRQRFHYLVIGITGSNGKTIVKEWLSEILSNQLNIVKSPNSYNSQIGVPLSVWQMNEHHQMGIFEAGISQCGEMEKLEKIISPTIGVFTNIGEAHSQFFNNNTEKCIEKLKLFTHSKSLVYCCDQKLLHHILQGKEYQYLTKISWGKNKEALFPVALLHSSRTDTTVSFCNETLTIPFSDAASVENALHITALLYYLHYQILDIEKMFQQLSPISMRLEIKEGIDNAIIINDTYSLDINSLQIALDFLVSQSDKRKKTVILSDFEQISPLENVHYLELNKLLHEKKVESLLAVGEQFKAHQAAFHFQKQYFFSSTEELLKQLPTLSFDHEAILIKGARSYQFEKITESLQYKTHKTILQVNLPAIVHNLNYYRSFLKPDTKVMAMVKALCYGLGDAEVINELVYNRIDYLAVAYTDEGVRLRQRNINTPIVVLGAEAHSFETMINYDLEPEIFNFHYLEELIKSLSYHPEIDTFNIHIKLDTGMHRLGFTAADLVSLATRIQEFPQLKVVSVFSHLAAAEDPHEDAFTFQQIAQYIEMSDLFSAHFPYPILRHILNSAGTSRFSNIAQFDMVRLGIGLYGCTSVADEQDNLQDPVTLKSVVTEVKKIAKGETVGYNRTFVAERDTIMAIIPIGYADGLPRELSNGVGNILIHGQLAPIIGKICMDVCMIDVTNIEIKEGDEVVIYGAGNPLYHIAKTINKIPYELLTAISRRVPREYIME